MIGTRNAKNSKLSVGDYVTVRWRDANGTFDAAEVRITHIFKTNVPTLDAGVLWIPLQKHQEMMQLEGEATILVSAQETGFTGPINGWNFKDHYFLLAEIREMIEMKCEQFKKLLKGYLAEELKDSLRIELEVHMIDCPACAKELELYAKAWKMLDKYEEIEPAANFNQKVFERIDRAIQRHNGWLI